MAELGLDDRHSPEAAHLLLSMVALCWFPQVHARTYLPAIGLDPTAPGFAEERKAHVVDLILHGIAGRLGATRESSSAGRRSLRPNRQTQDGTP